MIETEHLILRRWRESDAEALYRYASDVRVSEMALWPCHTSVEMSKTVIKDFFIPNPLNFAMTLRENGEPIGCIGLVPAGEEHYTPLPAEREIGYWIGYPYWGRGLTSEALRGLITWCSENLPVDSLMITTDAANKASRRVAEKCGFNLIADVDNDGIPTKVFRLAIASSRLVIRHIVNNKEEYMDLLLIGDESATMVKKYLDRGCMFAGFVNDSIVSVIVSTELPDGSIEVNNLAVTPGFRRKGIGRRMLGYVENRYKGKRIILGTGETPSTLRFYESCGYTFSHRISDFFTDNYPAPIIEEGVTLTDMIYLSKIAR